MLFNTVALLAAVSLVAAAPAPASSLGTAMALAPTTVTLSRSTSAATSKATSTSKSTSTSTSTAAAAAATSTTPQKCNYLLENNPWIVRKLQAFTAAPGTDGPSFVSFHLQDTNTGLKLNTMCSRYLPKKSTEPCEDPNNYYSCDDDSVQFMYDGKTVTIERTFTDPW